MAKERWIKPRHRFVRKYLGGIFLPYARRRYGIEIEPFDPKGRPHLILMNHQTAYDQFFISMAYPGAVYYVASEDLFSIGFVSRLIEFLVAPIPIKKSTSDLAAVKYCLRVAKEGGTIAMAPEGNRTFSGKTEHMKPAVAKLAKLLKMPIAFFRIEGGYGVHPRWSDVIRKGKMRAYISRVLEPEEYRSMTNEELFEVIERELYLDETELPYSYVHPKRAEYLERILYVCPECGLSEFESHGDTVECLRCGRRARYTEEKTFEGDFPFKNMKEWYEWQEKYISDLDPAQFVDAPVYTEEVQFSLVHIRKKKTRLSKNASLQLYGDRFLCRTEEKTYEFPFDAVTAVSVLGRNKLNIYTENELYQVKSGKRFNAVKFANFYYHYINVKKGEHDAEFLGL